MNILLDAMSDYPNHVKTLPQVISLDEFAAHTSYGKYALIINDPIKKRTLDILPSRRKDYLISYLFNNQNSTTPEFYELFDNEKHIVRIDMSEYMESHSVSRLVGAPPGYIGYDEGGQLTEAVRRNPYSIVLFDEIEKAHKDVFNILLQILDDGRITDSQGRTVDFKNTIIIMTSNLGSEYILNKENNLETLINNELKHTFKPEFLNRIDEIIIFNSLTKETIYEILDNIIKNIELRLTDKQLKIVLTDKCKQHIIDNSYDEFFGARPIKRYISKNIESLIANNILEDNIKFNSTITIDIENNNLFIK